MKKIFAISLVVFASLALSSCGGKPTFDADNREASLKAMAEGMDEAKKMELGTALIAIAIASGGDEAAVLSALDGKTADEIIAYAKSLGDCVNGVIRHFSPGTMSLPGFFLLVFRPVACQFFLLR